MITTRYVDVAFNGGRSAMARALYQYDYGQILRITDLDLPVAYEVHFAEGKTGNSVTQIGNADGVNIPDAMFLKSGSFYAWFYLHETASDGETRYEILFPVMQRAKPTNQEPTPVQQDAITEAIAALNAAVEQTGEDVEAAAASASAAADSESNSEAWAVGERDGVPVEPSDPTYHNNSAYYAGVAESASQGGEGFAHKAEGFAVGEQDGVPVESGSPYYHNNAEYYKNQSSGYSSNASAKASAAAGSALESEGWARGTQDGSEVSSGSPYYHHNAAYYAIDAGASAYNASVSETNAGNSATDAGNAKIAAQTAQGLAEAAKTAADADALKAEGYAVGTQDGTPVSSGTYYHNNAEYYAGEASGYATTASGYATDANNAKLAAQGAQTAAETAQGLAEAAQTGAEAAQTAAESARDAAIAATEDKAPVILDNASGSIVSIVDGASCMNARSLVAAFSPIQDLHGYENPWPAGGGMNIVPSTLSILKPLNTSGTWTENVYAYRGLTFTVNDNGTITLNGTSTASIFFNFVSADSPISMSAGSYVLHGIGSEDINITAVKDSSFWRAATTSDVSATASNDFVVAFYSYVATGKTFNNFVLKPMFEAGTTASAWSPYSNICPISGRTGVTAFRTGVNVWDEEWEAGAIIGGTPASSIFAIRSKNYCECVGGQTYRGVCNGYTNFYYMRIWWYDADKAYLSGAWIAGTTVTAPDNAKYFKISTNTSTYVYGNTYNHDISINYPATYTDYHAYTGASYPVTWQTKAGTVYGGTVDLVSGLLTVTHGIIDLGSQGWFALSTNNVFYMPVTGCANNTGTGNIPDAVCSQYAVTAAKSNNAWQSFSGDMVFSLGYDSARIYVRDTRYSDAETFQNAVNGVKVVYPLATPQTYQLDPQTVSMLLGANNVWATGDSVSLTYPCDTKLFIMRMLG